MNEDESRSDIEESAAVDISRAIAEGDVSADDDDDDDDCDIYNLADIREQQIKSFALLQELL